LDGAHGYEDLSPRAQANWATRLQASSAVRDGLVGSNLLGMSGLWTLEAPENRASAA